MKIMSLPRFPSYCDGFEQCLQHSPLDWAISIGEQAQLP